MAEYEYMQQHGQTIPSELAILLLWLI